MVRRMRARVVLPLQEGPERAMRKVFCGMVGGTKVLGRRPWRLWGYHILVVASCGERKETGSSR